MFTPALLPTSTPKPSRSASFPGGQLSGASGTPDALRPLDGLDTTRRPEEGSLAWLLAYGLEGAGQLTGIVERESGGDGPDADAGLQQAWAHAGLFYDRAELPGHGDPRFTAPVLCEPPVEIRLPAAPELSEDADKLRGELYEEVLTAIRDDFFQELVRLPDRVDRMTEVRSDAMGVVAAHYLLELPMDATLLEAIGPARSGLRAVRAWTPQQAFGRNQVQVWDVLEHLRDQALDALGADGLPEGPHKEARLAAAEDVQYYIRSCLHRLARMQKPA